MKKLVYTAHSGETAKYSKYIMNFVFSKGYLPVNPYEVFDYWMLTWEWHKGDKKAVIEDTIALMLHCDELWLFGESKEDAMSKSGVKEELEAWKKHKNNEPKFFTWEEVGIPKYMKGSKWHL